MRQIKTLELEWPEGAMRRSGPSARVERMPGTRPGGRRDGGGMKPGFVYVSHGLDPETGTGL